jgi:hypothetical protein
MGQPAPGAAAVSLGGSFLSQYGTIIAVVVVVALLCVGAYVYMRRRGGSGSKGKSGGKSGGKKRVSFGGSSAAEGSDSEDEDADAYDEYTEEEVGEHVMDSTRNMFVGFGCKVSKDGQMITCPSAVPAGGLGKEFTTSRAAMVLADAAARNQTEGAKRPPPPQGGSPGGAVQGSGGGPPPGYGGPPPGAGLQTGPGASAGVMQEARDAMFGDDDADMQRPQQQQGGEGGVDMGSMDMTSHAGVDGAISDMPLDPEEMAKYGIGT